MVDEEDPLAEVMTDKATVEIPGAGRRHGRRDQRQGRRKAARSGSELVVLEVRRRPRGDGGSRPSPTGRCRSRPPSPACGRGKAEDDTLSRSAGEGGSRERSGRCVQGLPGKPLASPAVRQRACGPRHRAAARARHRAGRPHHPRRPRCLCRRAAPRRAAVQLRSRRGRGRCRSSACAGRSPSICRSRARRIPHFSYVEEIDVTALEELRAQLNDDLPGPRRS